MKHYYISDAFCVIFTAVLIWSDTRTRLMWQPLQSVTFSHSVCLNTAQLCVCVVSLCNPGAADGGLNLRPLTGLCPCLSVSRQTVSSWVRSTRRRRPAVWPLAVWAARRAAAAARPPRPRPRPPLCALLPARHCHHRHSHRRQGATPHLVAPRRCTHIDTVNYAGGRWTQSPYGRMVYIFVFEYSYIYTPVVYVCTAIIVSLKLSLARERSCSITVVNAAGAAAHGTRPAPAPAPAPARRSRLGLLAISIDTPSAADRHRHSTGGRRRIV